MFYANPDCAFRITGVFLVDRPGEKNNFYSKRNHTAISYRISGNSQYYYNGKTLTASAGSVTYLPAHVDYSRNSTDETLFIIHLQGFENIGNTIELVENADGAEPFFRKLLSTWETKAPGAYNRCVQILYSIFEFLQTMNEKQLPPVPAVIKPGIELLQQRYKDSSLRIADLAKVCFVSEVYFRNIYARHFGESPQKTLVGLRFRHACELLSSGYYTQKESAQLAGFSDVKYFRTAFKKFYGITPSEYIKNNKNG